MDGGNVKVSKLWTRKGKQEAGAFLGQFDPSKSGRERRKKNTNYSNIVREYSRSFIVKIFRLGICVVRVTVMETKYIAVIYGPWGFRKCIWEP